MVTGLVLLVQLMVVLDVTVVNVALPRIHSALGFSPASLSWVLNAYTLAFGGLLLTGGRLGDVLGRRRVLLTGLTVFTLASLLAGLAQTSVWLIAARAAQGAGAALAAPGVLALLVAGAPDQRARQRALGPFSAVSVGGGTVGLLVGGVLTDLASWRWTLIVNVPIDAAVSALLPRHVAETPRRPGRFDVTGACAATAAAVSLVWALIDAPAHGWLSVRTAGGFSVGAAALLVLAVVERRVQHPMLPPALLRNRRRVGALIVASLVFGAQFAMFFLLVQYLQLVLGYGPLGSGLAFLPLTVLLFLMARLAPRLVSRYGQSVLLRAGTTGLTASFAWLAIVVPAGGSIAAVIAPTVLLGASAGITFMPATSLALQGVDPQQTGSASGLIQTAQQLGGAVGLAVIVSVYVSTGTPGQFTPGTREAFLTAAGFTLAALLAATVLIHRQATPGANA